MKAMCIDEDRISEHAEFVHPKKGKTMRKRKRSARTAQLATPALAIFLSASAFADANVWVYDTSGRKEVIPATAEEMIEGLDAKTCGLGETDGNAVDKWYWSWCFSNECLLQFNPLGMMLFIR